MGLCGSPRFRLVVPRTMGASEGDCEASFRRFFLPRRRAEDADCERTYGGIPRRGTTCKCAFWRRDRGKGPQSMPIDIGRIWESRYIHRVAFDI